MIEITAEPIDHAAVTERVRSPLAGAVCTFLGTVREITGDRRTVALAYEAYPEMALKKMAELEDGSTPALAGDRAGARAPRGRPRAGRSERGRRRELPAPSRVVRSVPVADRYAQGGRPDLEKGNLGGRQRGVGPPGTAPELRHDRREPDTRPRDDSVIMKVSRTIRPANPGDC